MTVPDPADPADAADSRGPSWSAGELTPHDAPDIRRLFETVFGAPMSEALWRWKYDDARGCASGVRAGDGALVAHYGGTRRTLCLEGQAIDAVQMGDVMVRPDARGVLSRNGPFARATRHFIDARIDRAGGFEVGFGFPGARHARLGERLNLYRALGEMRELRWTANERRSALHWRWQLAPLPNARPDRADAQAKHIDTCWRRMRQALPGWVVPKRDAAWTRHRYGQHPHHRYHLHWLQCRITRRRVGLAALRSHGEGGEQPVWEWLDWVGPPAYLPAALASIRAAAARARALAVYGWFSAPLIAAFLHPPAGSLRGASAPADDSLVCNWCVTVARAATVPAAFDSTPWWLMGGDTDFR